MGLSLRQLIPSMFVRRLLLIAGAVCAVFLTLAAQSINLTVVRAGEFHDLAEGRLIAERWTPTIRGRILDRKGRVLAEDRPAFDVLVDYDLITGDRAYSWAARTARESLGDVWGELGVDEREAVIRRWLPDAQTRLDAMWDALARTLGEERVAIDERRERIERTVERMARTVWERRLEERRAELNRDRERLIEVTIDDVDTPLREQTIAHTVATGVVDDAVFELRRLAERYDGIRLEPGGRRTYPFESVVVDLDRSTFPPPLKDEGADTQSYVVEGVGTHLLGWMRGVFREDIEARPRFDPGTGDEDYGHYRPGDLVGSRGVEGAREDVLRGVRGRVERRLDTGEETVIEPSPGGDVRLTLDVMLQSRVQALLTPEVGFARTNEWHGGAQGLHMEAGTPLNGSAVVLDIQTGEVLAAVSMPTFTRQAMADDPEALAQDALNAPLVNRPIATAYMPGSPMKPVILVSAVSEGVHALHNPIACNGHLLEGRPNMLRCWIYKQFGTTHNAQLGHDLGPVEAIGLSCNIYFYTLGRALGPLRITRWLEAFGIGRAIGLGVGVESEGNPGRPLSGQPAGVGDAIQMGIGQGPVTWTPLQAADVYATLARDGVRIKPRLFADERPRVEDLRLDLDAVEAALAGLEMSVSDDAGTGHAIRYPSGQRLPIFDVPGVRVWGKTGTATAAPTVDESGAVLRSGDHSWMLTLVGPEGSDSPRYAIAVVIEYGGSGGRVAGPIANQIVYALRAEGYL
ncbi:MAG: hypothetical protein Tsb0013_19890 [Phycisphaerales bacterium]